MKMITVKLNGKEVQADLLNPKVTKKVEDGFQEVMRKFEEARDISPGSEGIRYQCQAVIDYLSDIFGADAPPLVFGESADLLTCLDVLYEIQTMYDSQVNVLVKERTKAIIDQVESRVGDP